MLRSISLFLLLIILSQVSHAQSSVTDVPAAFNAISTKLEVLHLKKGNIKVPSGGHLQGIQCLNDSIFVITGSSSDYSYYLTAHGKRFTDIKKIEDSPFRHAGGCQLYDHDLVVGVEDNKTKDRSLIHMILFGENGKEDERAIIAYRNGIFKRSTAGAVGYTLTRDSRSCIAVGDWDSRNIDFYHSTPDDSMVVSDSAAVIVIPQGTSWCSYQSINLVTDTAGSLYLVGFGLDGTNNRADLFTVSLGAHRAIMHLIGTRSFHCKGASFRYGAGLGTTADGKLVIYSCARNVSKSTTINIFR